MIQDKPQPRRRGIYTALLVLSSLIIGGSSVAAQPAASRNAAMVAQPGAGWAARPTTVYTVNDTGNSSDINPGDGVCLTNSNTCTLRAALEETNAHPGADTILFNIAGSGLQVISPPTSLPTIIETVTINGYNQPGSSANTLTVGDNAVLKINLDGSSTTGNGLSFSGTNANSSRVQGLIINGFNSGYGISVSGVMSVTVSGNFIGTDSSGNEGGANSVGVSLFNATSTTVGGTTAAARNLISSNNSNGVQVSGTSTQNLIQNNYIGTNRDGTDALGNGNNGVELLDGSNNHVGSAGAGNLISGNGNNGLRIGPLPQSGPRVPADPASNFVQGNFIGTNATGDSAVPNLTYGVQISSANGNLIGGINTGEGNLISGNSNNGVFIDVQSGGGSTNNTLQANLIGTDSTGSVAVANGGSGVVISGAFNNTVGGPISGQGNVISGNTFSGVLINPGNFGGQTHPPLRPVGFIGNTVQGNLIGTTSGSAALGNGGAGVALIDVNDSQVSSNTIAYNTSNGVTVFQSNPDGGLRNNIRQNAIISNSGLGIDLGGDGVTANDACDVDSGANYLQNYPVLSTVGSSGSSTTITGNLDAAANTSYTLEFFSNAACDPTGNGEGETYLGSTTVTSGATCGAVPFSVTLPVGVAGGSFITADATDIDGNTSEFSLCLLVPAATVTPTGTATATASNTPTVTQTSTPTITRTSTPTVTQTSTPTITRTSTPTVTQTSTPTVTQTSTPTVTQTSTPTVTQTNTATSTQTSTTTVTPTSTPTASQTSTVTVTRTSTPTASQTSTVTVTPTGTLSPSASATGTLTGTPGNTATATATVASSATATVTVCNIQFSDVPRYSPFYIYIQCLACRGIVTGYDDGTFRPYNPVTRAQVSKIVVLSVGFVEPVTGQAFSDVPPGSTLFYPFIERLAERGLINGYDCGGVNPLTGQAEPCDVANRPYFRPGNPVTRGQLAKIDSNAAGYTDTPPPGTQSFEDVTAANDVFYIFIERLARRGIISGYDCGTGEINACTGLLETCDSQRRPYYRSCAAITRGQTAKVVSNTFFPIDCAPGDAPILAGR